MLTCGDVMVYPLYRHSGVCNGVPLLILHNASDATMYLDKELYSLFRSPLVSTKWLLVFLGSIQSSNNQIKQLKIAWINKRGK